MRKKYLIFLFFFCWCMVAVSCGTKGKNVPTRAPENNPGSSPGVSLTATPELKLTVPPEVNLTATPNPGGEISGITQIPGVSPEPGSAYIYHVKSEERKEEEDGVLIFISQISYPVFEGSGADGMNREISALVEEFKEELEIKIEGAKLDYADSKRAGEEFEREKSDLFLSVYEGDKNLLSIVSVNYSSAGGPHPNYYQLGFVYRMETADKISMDEFFKLRGFDMTAEQVAQDAARQFLAQVDGDGEVFLISKPLSETVLDFICRDHWYFNENKLVVFINPYEIAPYACGSFEYSLEISSVE